MQAEPRGGAPLVVSLEAVAPRGGPMLVVPRVGAMLAAPRAGAPLVVARARRAVAWALVDAPVPCSRHRPPLAEDNERTGLT